MKYMLSNISNIINIITIFQLSILAYVLISSKNKQEANKFLVMYNPDLSLKSKYEDKDIFGLVNDKNILELLYNYKK